MVLSANTRSSLFMLLGMGAFTFGDAITKYAIESIAIGQFMFIRGIITTSLLILMATQQGVISYWRKAIEPMTILRGVGEIGATSCYIFGLTQFSLGFVSSIYQAVPLAVTLGAAIFLAEKVGWRRWLSIIIGFIGVLIIINPSGDGVNPYAFFLLIGVAFTAVRDLSTRKISHTIPTSLISILSSLFITMTGLVIMIANEEWTNPTTHDFMRITGSAIFLFFGYICIIIATRVGDVSFASPFRYTSLLWALLLSFLIFGQVPSQTTLIGAFIVVCSGCYMLYREAMISYRARRASRNHLKLKSPL